VAAGGEVEASTVEAPERGFHLGARICVAPDRAR
jgi:hypothetical protein